MRVRRFTAARAGRVAAAVLMSVSLMSAGCGPRGTPEEGQVVASIPVRVTEIERGDITATVEATGTVRARDDVPISAEVGGRVVEVVAQVGDRVSEGDVLIRLDRELPDLAFQQAEAQVMMAEAELDDAVVGLGRALSLWERGDIADAEKEAAEHREKSARGAAAAARAAANSAARQLDNTEIKSPVDGAVAFMYAEVGRLVAAGTPVAHVVNDDVVEIDLGVSEDQVPNIHPRQTADVTVRALPGEGFRGTVEYVGRRADDTSKTYPVRVVLQNAAHRLRSGMVAEVTIAAERYKDVIVIERDWVVDRYGEPAVFVAADSAAVLRRVTLDRIIGDRVIVASGLDPGDRMITFGHDRVTDGALVEIKDAQADSASESMQGSTAR